MVSIMRRCLVAAVGGALLLLPLAHAAPTRAAESAAGPQTYLFFVFSDPLPGREAAYERWFADRRHVERMQSVPRVVEAERFVDPRIELHRSPVKTPQNLTLYTIQTDRPQRVAQAVARLGASGDAWPGPAVATVRTATYRVIGAPARGVGGEPQGARPGPSANYVVLAFHRVMAGQDAAFNSWYDTAHMPELMADVGVTGGQRGLEAPVQFGPTETPPPYLALLRISTGDLPAVFAGMMRGGPPSPAIDRPHSYGFSYRKLD